MNNTKNVCHDLVVLIFNKTMFIYKTAITAWDVECNEVVSARINFVACHMSSLS